MEPDFGLLSLIFPEIWPSTFVVNSLSRRGVFSWRKRMERESRRPQGTIEMGQFLGSPNPFGNETGYVQSEDPVSRPPPPPSHRDVLPWVVPVPSPSPLQTPNHWLSPDRRSRRDGTSRVPVSTWTRCTHPSLLLLLPTDYGSGFRVV